MKHNKYFLAIIVFSFCSTAFSWPLQQLKDYFDNKPAGSTLATIVKRLNSVNLSEHPNLQPLVEILKAGNKNVSNRINEWASADYELDLSTDVDDLVENLEEHKHAWVHSNQIAGYSNSLSVHAAALGIDLNGLTKVLPYGPFPLLSGKMEKGRHSPDMNDCVRFSNWGTFIATLLEIPVHKLDFSNMTSLLTSIDENRNSIGAYRIFQDVGSELGESTRQLYYVGTFLTMDEYFLAGDSLIKWLGDLQQVSRRLRKFIALVPNGQSSVIAFQNILSIPLFILDHEDSYRTQLIARYNSLQKRPFGSEKYYAELNSLALKAVEPLLAGLHLASHGFSTDVQPKWKYSRVHHTLNVVQYATNTFIVVCTSSYAMSILVLPSEVTETLPGLLFAIALPATAQAALHKGTFGTAALDTFKRTSNIGLKLLMVDSFASNVFKVATGHEPSLWDKAEMIYLLNKIVSIFPFETAVAGLVSSIQKPQYLSDASAAGLRVLPFYIVYDLASKTLDFNLFEGALDWSLNTIFQPSEDL